MQTDSRLPASPHELETLRERIDAIDSGLIDLIATRLELTRQVSALRAASRLPREDLARDAAVVRRASALARARGVEPEVARDMFWRLLDLSRSATPIPVGLPETQEWSTMEGDRS